MVAVAVSDVTRIFAEFGLSAEQASEAMAKLGETLVRLRTPRDGHKFRCQYRGNHDYACTCQPHTLWDRTLMWHCDCCEHPRSSMRYGLCDLCYAHQYDPTDKARADHEAASLD